MGWRKTGLWPFQPSIVLDTIKRPITPSETRPYDEIKTPLTVKGLRRFQKSCLQDPSRLKLKKLLRANETLLARTAIAEYRARNLQQALQIEKKKRKHGKKLNLADKEVACGQWWGVSEIMKARAKLEENVTGRMRSDHSGSVRRLAGCNYGGSGGRVLIMAAMAAARLN